MNRAEQIENRLDEIEAELAADPIHPPFGTEAYLEWSLDRFIADAKPELSQEQRDALVAERRSLMREYERLPNHLKKDGDA